MNIQILVVPYDSGLRATRMGRGPEQLLQDGLHDWLSSTGHDLDIEWIELPHQFHAEIAAAFAINRILAERVRAARKQGRFPLVLSGNCSASVGVIAGSSLDPPLVIWFDAHGDLNTPETTHSGYLDGMALSIAMGRCWENLCTWINGFVLLLDRNVVLAAARDLDPEEVTFLRDSAIHFVTMEQIRRLGIPAAFTPALEDLRSRGNQAHIHIDVDALEPSEAPSNQYAVVGGLQIGEMKDALQFIRSRLEISSLVIASYDPDYDPERRMIKAVQEFLEPLFYKEP